MTVFWTTTRRDAFRAILIDVIDRFSLTYPGMVEAINLSVERNDGKEEVLDQRTIRRFIENKNKTEPDNISAILMGVAETILERQGMLQEDIDGCVPLIEMYANLQMYKGAGGDISEPTTLFLSKRSSISPQREAIDDADGEYRPLPIQPRNKADRRKDIVKFLAAFSRPSTASSSVEKKFFRSEDADKVFFITYRFSATPGILQRSFTVIHRPKDDTPLVRFSNFIGEAKSPRRSGGIAINFDNEVVFLGHTDVGGSIKILSFSNASRPSDRYHGLLMTNDPEDGSLASRFLMVRTDISNHAFAQTGPVAISEIKGVLEKKWIERLRNRIRFELEEPVLDLKNEPVSQKDIVALVGRRLFEGTDPMLKDSKGFFNPADDLHYTFNSALKRDG